MKNNNTFHNKPYIAFKFSKFSVNRLTELTAQFLLGNSLQMRLALHPFCWRTSLIDALSSYVTMTLQSVTLFSPLCFL